jgi:hypothetical protein
LLASCVNLSKCNWKIKNVDVLNSQFQYLNVPKNKLEVHIYSTWPPFLSSHKFVLCLISKTSLLPEFPLFRFKLYGVVLPYSIQCMQPVFVDITPNAQWRLRPGKATWNCLNLQQRFLLRNIFQQWMFFPELLALGIVSGIVGKNACKSANTPQLL